MGKLILRQSSKKNKPVKATYWLNGLPILNNKRNNIAMNLSIFVCCLFAGIQDGSLDDVAFSSLYPISVLDGYLSLVSVCDGIVTILFVVHLF